MQKNYQLTSIKILSCAGYLPKNFLTNHDISKKIDTNDEWIFARTGIKQRHIALENEKTSDLAYEAASLAIKKANINADEIDLIIVATTTPDKIFPSTASILQNKLQIKNAISFDIQAVCAGFVYSLSLAESMIATGKAKNALIVGAEKMSSIVDWNDRGTCILFGDGAGAMVISASEDENSALIATDLLCDGSLGDILYANHSEDEVSDEKSGVIHMQGREVFRHAVEKMSESMINVIKKANIALSEIKYIVPHQANARIIEAIATKLGANSEQVILNMQNCANTSAASIPLALADLDEQGKLKKGDLILISALGGGIAWGASLIRW